jgi:polyisoprenoid-binding protein YceI
VSDLTAANGTWVIDAAHTNIGFSARHLMVSKVRGHFTAFEGGFTIDAANVGASSANLSIQAASIDTNSADRDGHLKSPDFLDVENFPTLTFVATSAVDKGTIVEVNVSELGLVTQAGRVVWGKYAQCTNNPEIDGCINAVLLV